MKLQYDELPTSEDLLGVDDSQVKGFFSKPSMKSKASVFSMGQRGQVLTTELEGPILVPHTLEKSTTKCPYEKLGFSKIRLILTKGKCSSLIL